MTVAQTLAMLQRSELPGRLNYGGSLGGLHVSRVASEAFEASPWLVPSLVFIVIL